MFVRMSYFYNECGIVQEKKLSVVNFDIKSN